MEVAALPQLPHAPVMALGDIEDQKDSDLLEMEDSDNMEIDQNEPILYQGPVFEGEENECLVKPELGFVKGNIKKRVKGFDSEEKIICPLVDRKSAILYDIVQQLEEEQLISTLTVLKSYKKPIVVPREILAEHNGSDIAVKIVDPEEWRKREEERVMEAELEEHRKVLGDLEYVNEVYREPFYRGWTREVVVRIHPAPPGVELGEYQLTSIGDVFYRDPAGNKIRSMKQIAISLEKEPMEGLSIKNFTFGKAPIGIRDPKKEILRKIISGRNPIVVTPNKGAAGKVKKVNISEMQSKGHPNSESPSGIKLKSSSSRRSIQPPKRYATSQTFVYPEKRSKTGTKKDVEYQSDNDMEMGMLPPKYPRGKEDFSGGGTDDSIVRRRGRPPTKKAEQKSVSMSDYNGGNDSELFQISAFHNHSQSSLFDAIDDGSQPEDEAYSGMPMLNSRENHQAEETPTDGEEQGSEELLPCSIRCPGMTGEIPTLQCKRCLCLYHPECLALPPNLNFKNFLCANCEGEHVEEMPRPSMSNVSLSHGTKGSSTSSTTNAMDTSKKTGWMPKLGESLKVKKPPPPLLPAFPKFGGGKFPGMNSKYKMIPPRMNMMPPPPLGRAFPSMNSNKNTVNKMSSGMSILRPTDDSMSISPITMKRGRGRPPKSSRLLPNLSNRNLTITPISIRPRLPVPNLAPMSKSKSMPLGLVPPKMKGTTTGQQQQHHQKMSGGLPKGRGLLPNLGGSNTGRLPDTIFREIKDMGRGMKSLQPTVPIINKGPGGFPPFKRYVQSVVSIGTKKFVAVPRGGSETPSTLASNKGKVLKKHIPGTKNNLETTKRPTPQPSSQNSSAAVNNKEADKAGGKSVHKFDSDQEVIQQVFQYLNVKDLLRASRVCRLWNTVATDANLWKVVRMKNHRISDVEAFTQFLKRHETEQIDLRKMISAEEMDWNKLFQSLSDVPSLRQIVLGPRTVAADRISSLSQLCPNIEIVTS